MDDKELNFTIRTKLDGNEKYATGLNTTVILNDEPVPYLARCSIDIRAGETVKLFMEQIPHALDLELKNAQAGYRFAYQDNTFWHEMRSLVVERNRRLNRQTGEYERPKVVCLCGSVRFEESFIEADEYFSLKGWIVVQPGVWNRHGEFHSGDERSKKIKEDLDELHMRKIEMADLVFVINKDGYVGESTSEEVEHAKRYQIPVEYMYHPETGKRLRNFDKVL